jgi:hypothetical protein
MGKLSKALALFFTVLIGLGLSGCGGGENAFGNQGTDGTTGTGGSTSALSVTVSLLDPATSTATTSISDTNPGLLRVSVTYNGTALESEVVTFSTTIGTLDPSSALTNSSGVASTSLLSDGTAGAGTVTASVTYAGETVKDTVNFSAQLGTVTTGTTTYELGYDPGGGAAFKSGEINLNGVTTLSAGGTLSATVEVIDDTGATPTTPVVVSFTSGCASSGLASLDGSVTTVNGSATATYLAQGCVGTDVITASASIGGTTYTAAASFTVQAADVGSIEFVSASPDSITLQGTGGAGRSETSTVTFRVVDAQGNPVQNQTVDFTLGVGNNQNGLSLDPTSATSDLNGLVQTVVQAGTVATSLTVIATVTTSTDTFQTQSSQLVVTTGIPDENSFDLSVSTFNPEAWNYSGEIVTVTARLADRFNNPVPDGTAIYFTTEGGSIDGHCFTTDGACSVAWTSQEPRPCGQTLGANQVTLDTSVGPNVCVDAGTGTNPSDPQWGTAPLGQPYGGRATILAFTEGEEGFTDVNGNGIFDDGDLFNDLPEAWRDENEDGVRQDNEFMADFNSNGVYDGADSAFNGNLCNRTVAPLCSSNKTLNVRRSIVIVMSGSAAHLAMLPATLTMSNGGSATASFLLSDLHNQPMPAGTTVAVTASDGFSIQSGSSYVVPSTATNSGTGFDVVVKADGSPSGASGTLTVTVTTPKGLVTTNSSFAMTEAAVPSTDVEVVSLTDSVDPVPAAGNVTYTAVVRNNSTVDAANVQTSFTVGSNFTFVSVSTTAGTCSGTATITCSLGTLAAGASETVTITLNNKTAGTVSSSITVSTDTTDSNAGNDTAGEYTTLQ